MVLVVGGGVLGRSISTEALGRPHGPGPGSHSSPMCGGASRSPTRTIASLSWTAWRRDHRLVLGHFAFLTAQATSVAIGVHPVLLGRPGPGDRRTTTSPGRRPGPLRTGARARPSFVVYVAIFVGAVATLECSVSQPLDGRARGARGRGDDIPPAPCHPAGRPRRDAVRRPAGSPRCRRPRGRSRGRRPGAGAAGDP